METLKELSLKYDLKLEEIISKIKKEKLNLVLLQFADGLKPYATEIVDELEKNTKAQFLIWFGTCFGACDFPTGLENLRPKIDLIVQFGHNELMPSY